MEWLIFLTLSSFLVSVDAFSAGMAIGGRKNYIVVSITIIGAIVFTMCTIACAIGDRFIFAERQSAAELSGAILIAVSIKGLFEDENKAELIMSEREFDYIEPFGLGVGVGFDGACACLSLSIAGYGYTPVFTVGIFHVAFALLGAYAGKGLFASKRMKKAPSVLVAILGFAKLFGIAN